LYLIIKGNEGMGTCKLDHSQEDVMNKFEAQRPFLPDEIKTKLAGYLSVVHTQAELNDMFHLLKKYDLSSATEKEERNKQMLLLLNKD